MELLDSILDGINNREEKSWKQLYATCYGALCTYSENIIGNFDDAKDIVQDLFVYIWYADSRFSTSKELLGYLYKSIYRNSLIFIRNKKNRHIILKRIRQEREDEDKFPNDFLHRTIQAEIIRHLYLHIKDLPPMQKRIIELSIIGLSGKEIAEKLGISPNTMKVQKSRGLKSLRKYMKNKGTTFNE
jgi:RNA polymerase sigma factor, sigma-70 family